MSDPTYISILL